MNDFKKGGAYGKGKPGGFSKGGFSRPSFGGGRSDSRSGGGRSFNGPSEMYNATCSKCSASCEVPFRPNGKKPIFCKNCFIRDDAGSNTYEKRSYNDRPSFEKRSYSEERPSFQKPQAPVEDPRIGAMQRELTVIHDKLDTLIQALEGAAYSSVLKASIDRTEKVEKPKKAAPAKKAVKKVAKKK